MFSSKFPCTDDAVEWQGSHALYLSPSEVIWSSWCQHLPCWMEFWCLNDVPLAVFPHQKPTPCSSSQPRSSITYIVPGLHCNAIQQNSQQSCAKLSKSLRPRRKSWTGLEWVFFGPGRDGYWGVIAAYWQASIQRHGWERILFQREKDQQTEPRFEWPMSRSQWNSLCHFGASPATETQRLLIYPTLHMLLPQPQMSLFQILQRPWILWCC